MRVVQIGLGPVGCAIARLVVERPELNLVGAVDPGPAVAGRGLADLLGVACGDLVVATDSGPLLDRLRPDVIVHATGSFLSEVAEQLRTALGCGAGVISTCEELAYPFYRHPDLARDLDAAAASRSVALLGAGVNPGFVMDKLVITLLGACRSVRAVRVSRVVDASKRRQPLQRKIGAGLTRTEFEDRRKGGRLGHVGLAESAHMIADALGLEEPRTLREELRAVLATGQVATSALAIAPGAVAGIDQLAVIEAGGRERVRLELHMAVDAEDPADRIVIDGSPPIEAVIRGGIHGDEATAALVVNCLPLMPRLKPGLRTMLDVPLRGHDLVARE